MESKYGISINNGMTEVNVQELSPSDTAYHYLLWYILLTQINNSLLQKLLNV